MKQELLKFDFDETLSLRIYWWNKERNLMAAPNESLEVSFLLEELSELYRAKTVEDVVDAYCDLLVFAYGWLWKSGTVTGYKVPTVYFSPSTKSPAELVGLVYDLVSDEHNESVEATVFKLIVETVAQLYSIGYNPEIALDECVKHIESRVGSINAEGKFIKDKEAPMYEPNYSLAVM